MQHKSAQVTVTVHGEPHPHSLPGPPAWGHLALSGDPQPCLQTPITEIPIPWVSVWAQPPGGQVAPGDQLVLNCTVAIGTRPLSFTWHREGSGAPLGTGPHLELRHVGNNDGGHYHCWVSNEDSVAESVPLNVTVLGEQDPWA
uniref:Ig-like domain-containing protein n=1 Tax=Zosterops lateralis melanops TaxID=1220523 RepID=A0A8D2PR67_ZOSLA